jgi:tetratricopeptide (TPR) repeat protein
MRRLAISKAQLGTVRRLQGRHTEAVAAHEEALQTFLSLGEPMSVATAWHQLGLIYSNVGKLEQAEYAYQQSLAIKVQQGNLRGEAATLNELGNLYKTIGRWDEAARFYSQAADIHVKLQNLLGEGKSRGNLSITLLRLGRHDEARHEVLRTLNCFQPYGHTAEIWKAWELLDALELTAGNADAAARAWQNAYESYLAYRREGGYGTTPPAQLCAAAAVAIKSGDTAELEHHLSQALDEEIPAQMRGFIPKLLTVLRGERDLNPAADRELDSRDAVELQLLMEILEKK